MAGTMQCLRCGSGLAYAGKKEFHEGSKWIEVVFGAWAEGSESYQIYYCPHCGHVEFFVDGVGNELRGE